MRRKQGVGIGTCSLEQMCKWDAATGVETHRGRGREEPQMPGVRERLSLVQGEGWEESAAWTWALCPGREHRGERTEAQE